MIYALLCLILLCSCSLAAQAEAVEPLDFSDVGVYGTIFDFCDFSVRKVIHLGENPDPKRLESLRGSLHKATEEGKRNLVGLYTFDRVQHARPMSEYLANTDAVLNSLDPKDVYAVFLSEENVTWNNGLEVLNTIYDHIKKTYPDLPVYQWMTAPDIPHPKMKADGWIYDLYRNFRPSFRRKLIKYVIAGKPVIMCLNASPDVAAFGDPDGGKCSQEQVDVCREFNIPMFFYCVDLKWGSPYIWLRSDSTDIVPWREWVLGVVDDCHHTDTSTLPALSAQYSVGNPIEVAGDEADRYEFTDDFNTLSFLDDSTIRGLLNLRWDGERESLYIERQAGDMKSVEIQYHFSSEFEISGIEAELTGQALNSPESPLTLALSVTGHNWFYKAEAPETGEFKLTSSAVEDADFKGREFWIQIATEIPAYGPLKTYCQLDALKVTCHVAPPERREVVLTPDRRGEIFYSDDFASQKYLHLAHITNKEQLTWKRGQIGTHGVAGSRNKVALRWKFVSEGPIENLQVRLSSWANERNLVSINNFAISLDGENKLAEETTRGKEADVNGNYRGTLSLDLSADERFVGIREFWVHAEMENNSASQTKTSNYLDKLEVEATAQK